ncbi:hypothetical protein GCM10011316_18930 [Roseibium aquae]|uniref:PAS domain S-box-containing protein/diguanylate cyclase (GGDEF)-like protein n=1 Tax=Roseibium aquae TaxID=1323746 RepID=A0A916TLB7_9HYPH|nr:PAS domain-containing protein [Roseibium aquae]GGB47011.1 hypothetical protein GCM10011316_18930 [Roseibium aquae]
MTIHLDRIDDFVTPNLDPARLLRGLLAACDHGVVLGDADTLHMINGATWAVLGIDRPNAALDPKGLDFSTLLNIAVVLGAFPQGAVDRLLEAYRNLCTDGTGFSIEVVLETDKIIAFAGTALPDGLFSIALHDVTEGHGRDDKLETALTQASLAKTALDHLTNAVSIKNARQEYIFVNDAFCRLHGTEPAALLGKTGKAQPHTKPNAVTINAEKRLLETGEPREFTQTLDGPDGQPLFLNTSKTLMKTGNGDALILTVHNNITPLKLKESALSKALQKAELSEQVLEQLKTPVIVRDETHTCIMMNQAYADYFEIDRAALIGRQGYDFLPTALAERMREFDQNVLTTGKTREDENTYLRGQGEQLTTVTRKGLALVAGHKPFVVTSVSDITRYKRQQQRLSEALERAQLSELVFDQLSLPLHVKDHQLRYVLANKAYLESAGLTRERLIGCKADDFFKSGVMLDRITQSDLAVMRSGLAQEFEDELTKPDGAAMPALVRKGLTRTDQNREYLVTVFTDITRLKEKESQLKEALQMAELAKHILDNLGNPVVVKDSAHRYVMVNHAFSELYGLPISQIIGSTPDAIHEPERAGRILDITNEVLRTRQPIEQEGTFVRKDGKPLSLQNRHSYLRTREGEFTITILNDVTRLRRQETMLKAALDKAELAAAVLNQLTNPIIVKNAELTYVMANDAYCRLVERDRSSFLGRQVEEIFPFFDTAALNTRDRTALTTGEILEMDEILSFPGGREYASITRKSVATTKSGDRYVVTVLNDVSKLKERERALQEALRRAELAQLVLDTVPNPVSAKDAQFRYVLVNTAYSGLFNLDREALIGRTSHECLPTEAARIAENMDQAVLETGRHVRTEELIDRQAEGTFRAAISSKTLATTDNGDRYIVGVITDVTDLKQREHELQDAQRLAEERNLVLQQTKSRAEFDSLHDPLTGLPNRRYLDQRLQEWREGSREKELALLQIDLDRFKAINDTLGHAAGDYILRHVAQVLRENCAEDDFIARIGGDEFVVLRESTVAREELEFLADLLISELSRPVPYENELCRFGASIGIDIGIASMGEDISSQPSDPARLMMNADIALYRAKRQGRGRFTFFSRDLQKEIERTKRISDDILDGLEKGEFFPVYQPQFDAKSLELIGVEALARWKHPVLGVLSPPSFLAAAKELGAADQIDQTILETALEDMRRWDRQNAPIPRIAVNVSAQRVANPFLINLLKKLYIPNGRMAFEVHESTMLDHTNEELKARIREIADLGIDIEIDNFGTGQSSFLGMWSASPRRVKIDRELVHPIARSEDHRKLLQAVIDMGRSINLEVVSEGVETMQHVKMLRDMGCDVLQGYALARPMTSKELVEFSLVNQRLAARG